MATSFSAIITALFATVYVVAVVAVCLFGFDWAIVGLMDLPSVVGMALYGLTGLAVAAFAIWFGRIAWRAEQMLGSTMTSPEIEADTKVNTDHPQHA